MSILSDKPKPKRKRSHPKSSGQNVRFEDVVSPYKSTHACSDALHVVCKVFWKGEHALSIATTVDSRDLDRKFYLYSEWPLIHFMLGREQTLAAAQELAKAKLREFEAFIREKAFKKPETF